MGLLADIDPATAGQAILRLFYLEPDGFEDLGGY
jgi:hypothetical protein